MWRNLKHLLIPHRGNGHKPHLLRDVAVEAMLGAVVVLLVVSFAGRSLAPHVDFLAAVYPSVLADLANESRAEHDLPALIESEVLAEAARLKAAHMIAEDYFEHVSPDGVTPWYWFDLVGYRYTLAGENLAINFDDSEPLNEAWMNSPAHRDNILGAGFSEVGIATAEGVLNGRNTTVVVQLFGTPARVSTDSSSPSVAGTAAESTEPEDEPEPTDEGSADPTADEPAAAPGDSGSSEGVHAASSSPQIVHEDGTLLVFSNPDSADQGTTTPPAALTAQSQESQPRSLFERLVVNPSKAVTYAYLILAALITVVLLATVVVEIQKQHPVNVAYGCLLLVVLGTALYINETVLSVGLF